MEYLTLSLANRFSFTCPIFDAKVEMRSCVYLRDKVYKGQPTSTRRGCQACISNGKCPAAEIVRRIAFKSSDATDQCSSEEEKHGRLPASVLEKIASIAILDTHLHSRNVTQEERDLIASSRERILAQLDTAPKDRPSSGRFIASQQEPARRPAQKAAKRATAPATPNTTAITDAAATGDLAAALNAS